MSTHDNKVLYRTVTARPFSITDKDGEILDKEELLNKLAYEATVISDVSEMFITPEIRQEIDEFCERYKQDNPKKKIRNNEIARNLNITYPQEFLLGGKSGRSRVNKMFGARVVSECLSWTERIKAYENTSRKYVSQGWKRTSRPYKPRNISPKINTGDADGQYCTMEIVDDVLVMRLVIQGYWYTLYFNYDKRFTKAEGVKKPSISVNEQGKVYFHFPTTYHNHQPHFSKQYIIGIDVGISSYATVSVYDVEKNSPVYSTTLSQRVHSLSNKVKKSNIQVASLQHQHRKQEAALHRKANSRRKRELAILAAQEIAQIAYDYDNAIVVFEDLSWIENTMQNGRWNRGELVKRTREQVELNGGMVVKKSCKNSSQLCCVCGNKVTFHNRDSLCKHCSTHRDRDVNASINMAKKATILTEDKDGNENSTMGKLLRWRNTKKNSKELHIKRSVNGSGKNLSFPGRDRTKNYPTPQQKKTRKKNHQEVRELLNNQCSARHNDDVRVALDGHRSSICDDMTVTSNTKNDTVNNANNCTICNYCNV